MALTQTRCTCRYEIRPTYEFINDLINIQVTIFIGNQPMPRSNSGRTMVSVWFLFCLVIAATYSGNLIAFLTVTKEKIPFNSLAELATLDDTYTWGTIGGTLWVDRFMVCNNRN